MRHAIATRLLFWQITALLVTALLVSALTYHLAWQAFNRVRDYGLEQIAYSVLRHGVKAAKPPPAADEEAQEEAEDLGQFVSQIWSSDGNLLYASLPDTGPPLQELGLHLVDWNDEQWRVYTLNDGDRVVQVAVTSANRASSFAELMPWLMAPLAVLVVVLALLIQAAAQRALRPLQRLREDIAQRGAQGLHPVATDTLPEELHPLGEALNHLLERIDGLLATQRQLVADAAHELNTPLAAIKLQAQLARRVEAAQRDGALQTLEEGIDRASHVVAQLLQLARLEPDDRPAAASRVDVRRIAARAVAAFSAQAEAQGTDLGLACDDTLDWHATGNAQDLRVMLDNLLDNALRHGGQVRVLDVQLQHDGDWLVLRVSDDGCGIPAADRQRALQRFVRLHPEATSGSGLGLSIVRRVVDLHGGELSLQDTAGGGLSVVVRLPRERQTGAATAGALP